jgi:hypothetical protein
LSVSLYAFFVRRFGTESTHWRTGRRGVVIQVRRRLHRRRGVLHEGRRPGAAELGHEAKVVPTNHRSGRRRNSCTKMPHSSICGKLGGHETEVW